MKKLLLLYLCLCSLFFFLATSAGIKNLRLAESQPTLSAAQRLVPYTDLQAASVLVKAAGGSGSGVLVTRRIGDVSRTFIFTAGHVAALARREDGTFSTLKIIQEERDSGKLSGQGETEAKVVAYSEAEDLALLEVTEDNFSVASASFLLDDVPPAVGTEVVHVGCTLGLYDSVSLGIVSQTDRQLEGMSFDQTSVMGYPGSSGGGVFLRDGTCIGLLTQGYGPGFNFIVPARRIRDWAKVMDIEWAIDPEVPVPIHVVRDPVPIERE